jgi:hypothetical protein
VIEKILTASGVPFKRSQFVRLPEKTCAVYLDDKTTDGPDGINALIHHDITVEVYEPKADDAAEAAIEAAIDAEGLAWTKQDRYWLPEEQRYQVIYEFSYIEKRRI